MIKNTYRCYKKDDTPYYAENVLISCKKKSDSQDKGIKGTRGTGS
jgi:hypothetical protein